MEPQVDEIVKVIEGGGNAALVVAAIFLYRAVKALTRIETFMSALFEVLLRSEGVKMRADDIERLKHMRREMSGKADGGFVMLRLLFSLALVGALAFAAPALSQTPCPSGPVASNHLLACWTNATEYTDGKPLPTDPAAPDAINSTQLRHGKCSANGAPSSVSIKADVLATVGSVLFTDFELGWNCVSVRHKTNKGVFSAWTGWGRKNLTAPPVVDKSKPPALVIR